MEMSDNESKMIQIMKLKALSDKLKQDQIIETKSKERQLDSKLLQSKQRINTLLVKEEEYEQKMISLEKEKMEREERKLKEEQAVELQKAKLLSEIQEISNKSAYLSNKEKKTNAQINTALANTQMLIADKRKKFVEKLHIMRIGYDIKQRKLLHETLREKKMLQEKSLKSTKIGNPSICFTHMQDQLFIESYCTAAIDDVNSRKECFKPKQFCYVCCDQEIGEINLDQINCCYNKCENGVIIPTCVAFSQSITTVISSSDISPVSTILAPVGTFVGSSVPSQQILVSQQQPIGLPLTPTTIIPNPNFPIEYR